MQASREQYCINPGVAGKGRVTEECNRLLAVDGPSCSWHANFQRLLGASVMDKLKVCASRTQSLCFVSLGDRVACTLAG